MATQEESQAARLRFERIYNRLREAPHEGRTVSQIATRADYVSPIEPAISDRDLEFRMAGDY